MVQIEAARRKDHIESREAQNFHIAKYPPPIGSRVKVWFDSRKDTHMTTTNLVPRKPLHSQDIAVWPDGTWTELGDVWNGEYRWAIT